ncbi:MAG: hypothetical protein SFY66_15425 [Oculatellaceae cyanobacterium bins.114]|nr:hypothetical protein [Oculatellaceae cyanobacterium bins.114]
MTNLRDRRIHPGRPSNHIAGADRVPRADQYQVYNKSLVNQTPKVANGQPVAQTDLAYRDGYEHGKAHEHYVEADLRNRDNENAARGMLFGIVFASLASAVIAALFIANHNPTSTPVAPVAVPVPQSPSPLPSPQTNNVQVRERVIERTQELVPVPQPQPPTVTNPPSGTVNQAPVTQPVPGQPQGQTTQPQTQTTQSTQGSPSQGAVQPQGTPAQGNQTQADTTQGTASSTGNQYTFTNPAQ